MSIVTKEFYAVRCDNCLDVNGDNDIAFWDSVESTEDVARDSDWYCDDGKHYCPDCFDLDDDDLLTIDGSRTK